MHIHFVRQKVRERFPFEQYDFQVKEQFPDPIHIRVRLKGDNEWAIGQIDHSDVVSLTAVLFDLERSLAGAFLE